MPRLPWDICGLRAQIIRDRLNGLDRVNTLLMQRGIDPSAQLVRGKRRPDAARKVLTRLVVLDALRDGQKCYVEIVALVAARRPEITPEATYQRAGLSLAKLRRCGAVARDGNLCRLAQLRASAKSSRPAFFPFVKQFKLCRRRLRFIKIVEFAKLAL